MFVEVVDRALAADCQQFSEPVLDGLLGLFKFSGIRCGPAARFLLGQIIADGVGENEIAIRQTLHQRAGAEPVGAVVGEVGFAGHKQPRHVAHQTVVHPQPAHRIVDRREDAHRNLVGALPGNFVIHVKQIAVAFRDLGFAQTLNRGRKIQINAEAAFADPAAFITDLLGGP